MISLQPSMGFSLKYIAKGFIEKTEYEALEFNSFEYVGCDNCFQQHQ